MNLHEESTEVVKSREITPLIDQARAKLPMETIGRVEMMVTDPEYKIRNPEEEAVINGYMRDAGAWRDSITQFWEPYKSFWHQLHRAACDAESETAPAVKKIRAHCESLLKDWFTRKKAIAEARQRQLEANTAYIRKQAEDEARRAAIRGNIAEAERLMAGASAIRTPVIMETATRLDGTSISDKWKVTVDDQMALIKAVADGRIPLMHLIRVKGKEVDVPLLQISEQVLKAYGSKLGQQLVWPGVRVEPEISFSVRSRA